MTGTQFTHSYFGSVANFHTVKGTTTDIYFIMYNDKYIFMQKESANNTLPSIHNIVLNTFDFEYIFGICTDMPVVDVQQSAIPLSFRSVSFFR